MMKFIIACVCVFLSLTTETKALNIFEKTFKNLHREPTLPSPKSRAAVETNWIEQKLDNFDPNENRTWQMRYKSNDQFFQEGGPVFIFVNGEWVMSDSFMTGGHMFDMAKEHNGYLFSTEHRFYGESKPTSDIRIENLKYNGVKQALADLANFIKVMKATIPGMENSKVILVGGSYSATMVTWFKKLYPDLIVGAWASSAPLLAKVDFVEYKEAVGRSINKVGGSACYNRIKNGIAELEYMIDNKRAAEVKAMLKLCDTFNEKKQRDVWTLFSIISELFGDMVQSHRGIEIQNACNRILQGEDDVTGLVKYVLENFGNATPCNNLTYDNVITQLSETNFTSSMMRQWNYQDCNEFGWYQHSGSSAHPFGTHFPLELYLGVCKDVYGAQFTNETIHQNVIETNKFFGGLNIEVENVYMTHGELDPWSTIGITDPKKATVIPLYSHTKDFTSIHPSDSPEMRASKEKVAQLVREWLK